MDSRAHSQPCISFSERIFLRYGRQRTLKTLSLDLQPLHASKAASKPLCMHTQHNSPLHNPKFRLENFKNSLSFCKVVLRIIIQYDVLAKQNSCDIVTINLPVLFQLIQRHPYVKSETGSLVLQAILKLAIYCSISLKS